MANRYISVSFLPVNKIFSCSNFQDGWGYDFRRNMSVAWGDYGDYATDIFTREAENIIKKHNDKKPLFLYLAHLAVHSANTYSPLQAPQDAVDKHKYIKDDNRRTFGGMLYKLDESVGKVVAALQARNMLQDSIIVFTTDNGGPAAGFNQNAASNWPLRGVKDTLWEGGVRGAGLIWSPRLGHEGRVYSGLMAVHDWLPTLHSAAGGQPGDLDTMDGMDMWPSLLANKPSPRNIVLHNIDNQRLISAIRVGDFKLLRGSNYNGAWNSWYGPSGRDSESPAYSIKNVRSSPATSALAQIGVKLPTDENILMLRDEVSLKCNASTKAQTCDPTWQVCLFNITSDPCEQNNLLFKFPSVVKVIYTTGLLVLVYVEIF